MADDLEDTIDGFVELEDELTSGSATTGEYHAGTVSGGTKVAVADVPDGYPASFDTDHALHLEIATDDGPTVDAYLPWPEPGSDADLVARLLDNLGLDADEFANIYGETVALEPLDGWHRVDVDRTGRGAGGWSGDDGSTGGGGSDLGGSDFGGGSDFDGAGHTTSDSRFESADGAADGMSLSWLLPATGIAMASGGWLLIGTSGGLQVLGVLVWLVSLLALPAGLFYDAHVTSRRGGWDPHPVVWGGLGIVPTLNVPLGVAYLVERRARSGGRNPLRTWTWGLVGATLLSTAVLPTLFVTLGYETAPTLLGLFLLSVWPYSIVLLPLAIYFDGRHVEDRTDWDPVKLLWMAMAVVTAVFFVGWIGGGVYLLRRTTKLG